MTLAMIEGQQQIFEQLQQLIRLQRVSHAYIFAGPKGVGKTKVALQFAMTLNCQNDKSAEQYEACGKCSNCLRIASGSHPDVLWIAPDGRSVKIDQIRQMQKDIGFKSVDVRYKLFIIEQTESLTEQAANSLLKLLEEPINNIISILLVENHQQLLPTIRSRAQLFSFQPQEAFVMLEASVEQGSDLIAMLKSVVVEWTEEIVNRKYAAIHRVGRQLTKEAEIKDNIQLLLDMLLLWYRDLLDIKLGMLESTDYSGLNYLEHVDLVKRQALQLTKENLLTDLEGILEMKKRLAANANLQLVLEQMIFSQWEGR